MTAHLVQQIFIGAAALAAAGSMIDVTIVCRRSTKEMHARRAATAMQLSS